MYMSEKEVKTKEIATTEELPGQDLIAQAIKKGASVATMERLLAMRRELKAEKAKEDFDTAMSSFQADCPTIKKTKEVKTRNGDVAYRYAPIESIVSQVKDILLRHGFSYSTNMEMLPEEKGVKVTCRVIHSGGHSEESSMTVPFGTKTQVMSDSQVAAAATTFAKRYAFCNAFGILTGDEDNDGASFQVVAERPEPRRVERVIDVDDPPFVTPTEKKQKISQLLKMLSFDVKGKKKDDIEEEVWRHTSLALTEEHYDTIIKRLETIVLSERNKEDKNEQ